MTDNKTVGDYIRRAAEIHEEIITKALLRFNSMPDADREKIMRERDERMVRIGALTPLEKYERLKKPTCIDDYGLKMTFGEIAQVPEAAAEINAWKNFKDEKNDS